MTQERALPDPPRKAPRQPSSRARPQRWTQDPEGVRRDILDVARAEFVEKGLSGARVDDIAAKTSTSKRMIYYYFRDKAGLYLAVLTEAYNRIRAIERGLDLDNLPPVEALKRLAGTTFDYHAENPDFVRLVMVENIHHARHLKASPDIGALNLSAIEIVGRVYARGVATGVFRAGLDPLGLHLTMNALSFYNVSNRATLMQVFGRDMAEAAQHARRREEVVETLLRFVET